METRIPLITRYARYLISNSGGCMMDYRQQNAEQRKEKVRLEDLEKGLLNLLNQSRKENEKQYAPNGS